MKKFLIALCILYCFLNNYLSAQRCGSMEYLQQQLQADPDMATRRQAIEDHTNQFFANYHPQGSRAIITIPVVVHVVYNTAAQNVSDAQIQSQIDRLNLDYHKLNTDWTNTPSVWQSLVADYEIQFCLASRDPNGNTTTGIIRKQTSITSFSTNDNVKRAANGGDNAWSASSYLNIWVCNLSGGVLGYAQFPGGAAATDGVVITYKGFGSMGTAQAPYNKGRTATHEVGHWLNLYHIWGDDGSSCSGSDQVNDTPNQGSEHYGCPSFPQVSCSNGPNGDMFMNYMDYTDDACMYMFTTGQKTRSMSLFATGGSRVSLLSSQGCQAIASPPVANFTANTVSSCTGLVSFTDQSTNSPTSWSWNFGDGQTSTQQNPTHFYTANGNYTVSLTATNSFGSNTKTVTNYITINKPAPPSANNISHCGASTFTLSTSSTNPVAWLDSSGNKISSSNPFITPMLNHTTTYWLQDTVGGVIYHAGPANNSGGGGYLNSNWALIFNVTSACTLQSVYVYANGAGNRTFELRNSGGTVLQSLTVNVSNGGSRVTLNFNLTPGTAYQLGFTNGSAINLYRNNTGAVYPYNDAGGYISITGNNATNADNYYYYCYDWIIKGVGCVSQQKAVTAIVSSGLTTGVTTTNASCGANNGSASATVVGGTSPYIYSWSNGSSDSSIHNIAPAVYTVTITDINSCSGTATANIMSASDLTASKSFTDVSCFGGNNGIASVSVTSGTSPYTFAWSNNAGNVSAINNITAGVYFVTIADGNNCTHVDSFYILEPSNISLQVTANDAYCFGESTGSASITASGGNGGFNYLWSANQSGNSIANLQAGNYSVTATDTLNCTALSSFVIDEPDSITTYTTTTDITCFGDNNGKANVIASGGIGNYTYMWCNGNTTHNASNLAAGNCAVTVTDDNGCTAIAEVNIQQPPQIQITTSSTNQNASVSTVSGGNPPYTFAWSNGDTTQAITNLASGNYYVTVTDNNDCTTSAGVAVLETKIESPGLNGINFSVYPNPANDDVILVFDKLSSKIFIRIKNILGQEILTREITSFVTKINLASFSSGVYLIEVNQNDKRVIKQLTVHK